MDGGFDAGVREGGLRNSFEVNILVGYVLSSANVALSVSELQTICLEDGLVNYFELANSLGELKELGQITFSPGKEGQALYSLTEKGRSRTELLVRDLPRSVRDTALRNTMNLLSQKKRMEENRTEILKVDDGYQVCLSIPDVGTDLLELKVFVPNMESASRIQARFLNNPRDFYQSVWSLLTGNNSSIRDTGE